MNNHQIIIKQMKAAVRGAALALALLTIAGNGVRAQTMPPNLDFGYGNFTNWLCYTGTAVAGTATTGTAFGNAVLSGPIAGPPSRHALTSGPGIDPVGQLQAVAPGGGIFSMRIGNSSVSPQAERIRYYLHVPAGTTRYSVLCQFAVVLDNGGGHPPAEQPSFHVVAYDSASGNVIPSANNIYLWSGIASLTLAPPNYMVSYLDWTPSTINLSGYGGKTVILEVMSSDCSQGGHFGYGYFDVTSVVMYLAPTVSNCDLQSNTVQVQAPPGYKYYQWYNQNFSTALNPPLDTTRSRTLPLPSTSQYYNLVMIPLSSTGIPDTIRTNVFSNFTINATATATATCVGAGDTVQLNTAVTGGLGNFTYQWSGDTTLSSSIISNPTASPLTRTQYVVKVSDTNGCFRRDTVQVSVGAYLVSAGPDITTCPGSSVNLNGSVTPSTGSYTYTWMPGSNLSSTSVLTPSYTPSATGSSRQFILRVDSGACSLYDTMNVYTLSDTITVRDTTVCAGVSVIPFVQGETAYTYTWSPATRLTFMSPATPGSDQQPVFNADTTTTFTITASYAGCTSIIRQLTVHVDPLPLVSIGNDTVYKNAVSPISLSASVSPASFGAYNYTWSYNGFIDSLNNANISFSGTSDTTLYVTVTTPAGCSGTDSVHVIVSNMSIMIMANAFTPGASLNGSYRIVRIQPGYTLRSFRIYNRWGKKVFETTNAADGWDGSYNGKAQPMGAYVYALEAVSAAGKSATQQGSVTLIR